MGIIITSENNFNTASGLASSASGLACLAVALCEAYQIKDVSQEEISMFARLGSGSACRSVLGGFVEWHRAPQNTDVTFQGFKGMWLLAMKARYPDFFRLSELLENDRAKISQQCIATRFVFDSEDWWF